MQPLTTIALFSYNSEKFIQEAVNSVLSQDYHPLEVILSDDSSTDASFSIMKKVVDNYLGPHKVVLRRNHKNLGLTEHINEVWKIVTGEWLVVAAGDDISRSDRVSVIMQTVRKNPEIKLTTSYADVINFHGEKIGLDLAGDGEENPVQSSVLIWSIKDRIQNRAPFTLGATFSYSREVFDVFPSLPVECIFEDNIIGFRSEILGKCALIRDSLVYYRKHVGQTTNFDINEIRYSDKKRIRNYSDGVVTTNQNMIDFKKIMPVREFEADLMTIEQWLSRKLIYSELIKSAVTGGWPVRVFYFFRLSILRHKFMYVSRDLMLRVLLPDGVYFFLKKMQHIFVKTN